MLPDVSITTAVYEHLFAGGYVSCGGCDDRGAVSMATHKYTHVAMAVASLLLYMGALRYLRPFSLIGPMIRMLVQVMNKHDLVHCLHVFVFQTLDAVTAFLFVMLSMVGDRRSCWTFAAFLSSWALCWWGSLLRCTRPSR